MKTIDQLTETTNTENLYVLGTQNNQSVKYNIESAINIVKDCNDLIGGGGDSRIFPTK